MNANEKDAKQATYEVWLVPNGRLRDFDRGITGEGWPDACHCWGSDLTFDEVLKKYRELADENFRDAMDEQCYTAIWNAAEKAAQDCGQFSNDDALKIGEAAADKALQVYVDRHTEGNDPTAWPRIEWQNDGKYVMVRESKNQ